MTGSPRPVLRRLARHRAVVAGALAALAVGTAVDALAPREGAAVAVLTASRDLPAGTALTDDHLATVRLPRAALPAGALRSADQARGSRLAAAVRAGEPLTDVRLLGAGLLPPGGEVAVPVRVAEPAVAYLLQPGDHVDVLAASPEGAQAARTVVSDVVVLAVPARDDMLDGALVVLAATAGGASRLAAAAVTDRLSVAVRGR